MYGLACCASLSLATCVICIQLPARARAAVVTGHYNLLTFILSVY